MNAAPHEKVAADLREFGFHPLSLRLWHGMALDSWLRTMRGNWGKVSPRRYPLAFTITLLSVTNQLLKWASELVHGRSLARTRVSPDPIFIIGHWRSGTTWLHQLLMQDPRFGAPTRLACFCPETFLLTQGLVRRILRMFLPDSRPMDNVDLDPDGAEEDEVALLLSGAMSSYRGLMFPNDEDILAFSPVDMSANEGAFWRRRWNAFLTRVQMINPGKRLVLKSPTHSLRIAEILHNFPDARFIHIHRDPYKVYMSNLRTRRAMYSVMSLQDMLPSDAEMEARAIFGFREFHRVLESDKALIPKGQLATISYEDLCIDPAGQLAGLYDHLNLGDFTTVKPQVDRILDASEPYQNNRYDLSEETRRLIDREFGEYFDIYGYLPMDQRPVVPE